MPANGCIEGIGRSAAETRPPGMQANKSDGQQQRGCQRAGLPPLRRQARAPWTKCDVSCRERSDAIGHLPGMFQPPEGGLVRHGFIQPAIQGSLVGPRPEGLSRRISHSAACASISCERVIERVSAPAPRVPGNAAPWQNPPNMKLASARMPSVICFSTVSMRCRASSAVSRVDRPRILRSRTTSRHRGGNFSRPS